MGTGLKGDLCHIWKALIFFYKYISPYINRGIKHYFSKRRDEARRVEKQGSTGKRSTDTSCPASLWCRPQEKADPCSVLGAPRGRSLGPGGPQRGSSGASLGSTQEMGLFLCEGWEVRGRRGTPRSHSKGASLMQCRAAWAGAQCGRGKPGGGGVGERWEPGQGPGSSEAPQKPAKNK